MAGRAPGGHFLTEAEAFSAGFRGARSQASAQQGLLGRQRLRKTSPGLPLPPKRPAPGPRVDVSRDWEPAFSCPGAWSEVAELVQSRCSFKAALFRLHLFTSCFLFFYCITIVSRKRQIQGPSMHREAISAILGIGSY